MSDRSSLRAALPDGLGGMLLQLGESHARALLHGRAAGRSRTFVIHDGRLLFGFSPEPTDALSKLLARFGAHDAVPAAVLGDLSPLFSRLSAVADKAADLRDRTREALLELFLWPSGTVEAVTADASSWTVREPATSSDLAVIAQEGTRRRARWRHAARVLPDPTVVFERSGAWPEGFPRTPGDIRLGELVDAHEPLVTILATLGERAEYAVMVRLAGLVQAGALAAVAASAPVDPPAAPPSEPGAVIPLFEFSEIPAGELTGRFPMPALEPAPAASSVVVVELAARLREEGRLDEAHALLSEENEKEGRPELWAALEKVEVALAERIRAHGLRDDVVLRLGMPIDRLVGQVLTASEAFVLSRFAAGPRSVGGLLELCPMPSHEVLEVLHRFLETKALRRAS